VFVNGTHGNGGPHGQQQAQGYQPQQGAHAQPPKPQGHMNYGTSNASAPQHPQQNQNQHPPQEQGTTGEAGPSDGSAPPPSYAQVVAGDHKVQNHE
jgi:hypothetical protein